MTSYILVSIDPNVQIIPRIPESEHMPVAEWGKPDPPSFAFVWIPLLATYTLMYIPSTTRLEAKTMPEKGFVTIIMSGHGHSPLLRLSQLSFPSHHHELPSRADQPGYRVLRG